MRGEAWKMLFGNLLFVIGVPVAIVQLVRAYSGGVVGGVFRGLDTSNLKARKGDLPGAMDGYQAILQRVQYSAGLKYNLGMSLLNGKDHENAARTLQAALDDCSNYTPAAQLLAHTYQVLGDEERLAALRKRWGMDDANNEATGETPPE